MAISEVEFNKYIEFLYDQYKQGREDIPKRVIDKGIKEIIEVYGNKYNEILLDIAYQLNEIAGLGTNPTAKQQKKLLDELERKLLALNKMVTDKVSDEVVKSYVNGQVATTINYIDMQDISDLRSVISYSLINTNVVADMVADTMEDLLFVTQHTNKQVKKVVRDVFRKNWQLSALGEKHENVAKVIEKDLKATAIKKKLYEDGFIGIVDKAGRRWKLNTYVDMAVRTKAHQSYVQGAKDRSLNYSTDLAKIPNLPANDTCKLFTGMIISLNGTTKGYMTYDQLKATGLIFHPNCKHSPLPIGKIDMLPKEDIQDHNNKVKELNSKLSDWKKEHPNNKMGKEATKIQKDNTKLKEKQSDMFKDIDKDIKKNKKEADKKAKKVVKGQISMFD